MWHLLHYQLLHNSAPPLPLTATQSPSHPVTQSPSHPVTQSPSHPSHAVLTQPTQTRGTVFVKLESVCAWHPFTSAGWSSLISDWCSSLMPQSRVKGTVVLPREPVALWFTLPKADQTPHCPKSPIKIHVAVTFRLTEAWFISSGCGAAFLFLIAWCSDSWSACNLG